MDSQTVSLPGRSKNTIEEIAAARPAMRLNPAECLLSHPPRAETKDETLARRKQARPDLDRAFLSAPNNVRLLRMHCQPPEEKIPSGRAMLQEKAHHDGRPGAL